MNENYEVIFNKIKIKGAEQQNAILEFLGALANIALEKINYE